MQVVGRVYGLGPGEGGGCTEGLRFRAQGGLTSEGRVSRLAFRSLVA